jgi:hypothetical protein
MGNGMSYRIYICGPYDCPNDPAFEHDNYFGCMPKDFNQRLGTSKRFRQSKVGEKYRWNGGCDPARLAGSEAP